MQSAPHTAQTKAPPRIARHCRSVEDAEQRLETDRTRGLATAEAKARLATFGTNELKKMGARPWFVVLANQFFDVLILILVLAAAVSLLIGHVIDAATILTIVVLNGALGFVQEWRAERSLEALQQLLSPKCTVVRDGVESSVDSKQLVPGDLVRLEIGNQVPA